MIFMMHNNSITAYRCHSLFVNVRLYYCLICLGKSLKKNPMTPKAGKTPKTNEDGGVIKKKTKKKKKRLPKVCFL